jgi:hypothetical protein
MKDIVVSMNVFDGLAHNTGDVMPKLVDKELEQKPVHFDTLVYDVNRKQRNIYEEHAAYKRNILNLMDSKELEDPIEVYKEVEHIIGTTPYKQTFNDWIKRIVNHPAYNASTEEDRKSKLNAISVRKKLIQETILICGSAVSHLQDAYKKFTNKQTGVLVGSKGVKHYAKNISHAANSLTHCDAMNAAEELVKSGVFNANQFQIIKLQLTQLIMEADELYQYIDENNDNQLYIEQLERELPAKINELHQIVNTIDNAVRSL